MVLPVAAQESLEEKLQNIKLPEGFHIEVFAENVPGARQMVRGDNGTIFVGSFGPGKVSAVVDTDGDHKADKVYTLLSRDKALPNGEGVAAPMGVTMKGNSLYVGDGKHILRFDDIESKLENPGDPAIVVDDLPKGAAHYWKIIDFGPDEKLYVPIGSPCNACDVVDGMMRIIRMDADGSNREVVALGVRNSLGFDWDPETGDFWFTDNGMDDKAVMGEELPFDELNRLSKLGEHFGFPFIHGGDQLDPKLGLDKDPADYTVPAQKLNPHAAAMGMLFYNGSMFPSEYKNAIFIAEHASYKRQVEHSYRVSVVTHDGKNGTSYKPFATGWMKEGEQAWGKPFDVLTLPDGSMLISDDTANAIYRITYKN
jgi:glucose/arabinose dehydrogenase